MINKKNEKVYFKEIINLSRNNNVYLEEIRKCYNFFVKKGFSLNKKIVNKKNHKLWFKIFLKNKFDKLILAVDKNKNFLGYVRTKKYYNYFIISIAITPKKQKRNIASQLLNKIIKKTEFKSAKFIAIVKKKNTNSLNFFKRNNFRSFKTNSIFFKDHIKNNQLFIFRKKKF